MLDLVIKPLQNGGFELGQQSGLDDECRIELHAVQIRLLAERAGLLPAPDPKLLDRLTAAHVRRLLAVRDRLSELLDSYHDEILDRCGSGIEISLHLRAISELVDELVDEIGTIDVGSDEGKPAESNDKSPESNDKSDEIRRDPTPSRRGRPERGNALSNAERQARHRDKQGEPAAAQQLELA